MRRILYVSGTRADWGKLRPLVDASREEHDVHVAVTGQHLDGAYGFTTLEIERHLADDMQRVWRLPNGVGRGRLDMTLSRTVDHLSHLLDAVGPALIVVHGDRAEALAGAYVGAANGVMVAHVEGGEVSGTLDESVRHAVSKLAHLHLVSNERARERVLRLGEEPARVHVIGSPEVDVMLGKLPSVLDVEERYGFRPTWSAYGLCVLHPVIGEDNAHTARQVAYALDEVGGKWIVLSANADPGGADIDRELSQVPGEHLPSMRHEHFLLCMRNARVVVGNSSAGVREAPVYGTPSVDVGTRQRGRSEAPSVQHVPAECGAIARAIRSAKRRDPWLGFGDGRAAERWAEILRDPATWETSMQKQWRDVA